MSNSANSRKNHNSDFSIGSGVATALHSGVAMKLDKYGQYRTIVGNDVPASVKQEIAKVDAMSDGSVDENVISKELYGGIEGIKHNALLGYYIDLYAGYVVEGNYRENASSGGMTTWLLSELLRLGEIDGVIHAKHGDSSKGRLFEYGISNTGAEILDGARTKYYPLELSDALRELKTRKGRFAVVGIPSFIMELRLLAKADSEIADKIKYMFGLVCGHQKSAKYTDSIAWQFGIRPGDLSSIDYRKKVKGHQANDYATTVTGLVDGKKVTLTRMNQELFGVDWGQGFFKQKFSDFSDDAFNETADVVFGDAWLDEYVKDYKGNNVVIVRNERLAKMIRAGINEKRLKLDAVDEDIIIRSQHSLVQHAIRELPYRLYKYDKQGMWRPKERVRASSKIPFLRRRVQDLRAIISRQSHRKFREAVERNDWSYFERSMAKYTFIYRKIYTIIGWQRKAQRLLEVIGLNVRH